MEMNPQEIAAPRSETAAPHLIDPQALAEETSVPPAMEAKPSAPPQTALQRFFVGPFGLRAGWSLLIYFGVIALVGGSLWFVGHQIKMAKQQQHSSAAATKAVAKADTPAGSHIAQMKGMIGGEAIVFAAFLLLSWLMAVIERRRLSAFGLGGEHVWARALVGAAWGLIAMSGLIAVMRVAHLLTFDQRLDHGLGILGWGAVQLLAFLLVGLTEEYMFRGYLQFTLTRGLVGLGRMISPAQAKSIAFWMAAFLTSALFLLAHAGNDGENKLGLIQVFLAGLLFLVALWRTGSLWWAIGFHTTWDWAQSFLFGVPDSGGLMQGRLFATHASGNPLLSGGTVGPEGSVLCSVMIVLMILVVLRTTPSPLPPLEVKPKALPVHEPAPMAGMAETAPL